MWEALYSCTRYLKCLYGRYCTIPIYGNIRCSERVRWCSMMSLKEQGSLVYEEVGVGPIGCSWTFIMHVAYSFQPKTIILSRLAPRRNQTASVTTLKTCWKGVFLADAEGRATTSLYLKTWQWQQVGSAQRANSCMPVQCHSRKPIPTNLLSQTASHNSLQKFELFFFFKPHRFFWFVCLFVFYNQARLCRGKKEMSSASVHPSRFSNI